MTPVTDPRIRDGRLAARIATVGMVLLFLGGLWLCVAPFAIGDQPRTGPWFASTRTDLITGGVLAGLSAFGLLIVTIAAVGELYARGDSGSPATAGALPTTPAPQPPGMLTSPENQHGHR